MMTSYIHLTLLLFYVMTYPADGAKVLLVPVNVNSHVQYMSRLGVALADEGHVTVIVVAHNAKFPDWARDSKMAVWTYQGAGVVPYSSSEANSRLLIGSALAGSALERLSMMVKASMSMTVNWEADCVNMMENSDVPAKAKAANFDLAIMDAAGLTCNYALPYSLDLPFASFSIYSFPWVYRVPGLPSFVPNMMSDSTDQMTFKERLQTTLTEAVGVFMANHTGTLEYSAKYAPHRQTLDLFRMAAQSVFYFYLDDIAIGYPKPLMPNTANIGDIMASLAKPLPEGELREFVEASPEGVVVVSFGSYLNHLPENILLKLCDGFKLLTQRVVWKLTQPDLCKDDDIFTLPWIPQNDLLGHKKVVAFVTHAGLNSLIESVYHSVPVVSMPISLDQPYNARFMESRGIGQYVNIRDFSPEELADKISHVINDPDVRRKIQLSSAVLREKPQSPGKRASFWVNHVIKHGGEHLRTGAFKLSVLQFYMVDIFLFLFLAGVAIIVLLLVCLCYSFKGIKHICCKHKSQSKKPKLQ